MKRGTEPAPSADPPPDRGKEGRSAALSAWALAALLVLPPLVAGLGALSLGKHHGWDFHNYHHYNAHAFVTGRSAVDVAPAQLQSYYNPVLDLPMYALVRSVPAPWVGFGMGALQGLNLSLVVLLFLRLWRAGGRAGRLLAGGVIALAGFVAPASLSELGGGTGDNLVSLLVLAGLLAAVSGLERPPEGGVRVRRSYLVLAGLALGLAVGLKQTAIVFALGAAMALPCVVRPWRASLAGIAWLGLAGVVGVLLPSGHWLWTLWRETGNPVFPYFNHVFRSPLIASAAFVADRFVPREAWEYVAWPLVFAVDSSRASYLRFTDLRFAALYLALVVAGVGRAREWTAARWRGPARRGTGRELPADGRRPPGAPAAGTPGGRRPEPASRPRFDRDGGTLLVAFAVFTFVAWMPLFSIYRYLLALELLVPLCFLIVLDRFGLERRVVRVAGVLTVVLVAACFRVEIPERLPWTDDWVTVDSAGFDPPPESLVVMLGWHPMAYVIPELPPDVAWVRPGGNLWLEPEHGLYREIAARVRDAEGALYVAYGGADRPEQVLPGARRLGLEFDPAQCSRLRIDPPDDIRVCPAERLES